MECFLAQALSGRYAIGANSFVLDITIFYIPIQALVRPANNLFVFVPFLKHEPCFENLRIALIGS